MPKFRSLICAGFLLVPPLLSGCGRQAVKDDLTTEADNERRRMLIKTLPPEQRPKEAASGR
jgi:hypothetical protein